MANEQSYNPKLYPKGPFREEPVSSEFKVKEPGFFSKTAHRLDKEAKAGLKVVGKGVGKGIKTSTGFLAKKAGEGYYAAKQSTRGVLKPSSISNFRNAAYQKRKLALERKENIAVHKANIAQQKALAEQAKTTKLEARFKKRELKQQQKILQRDLRITQGSGFKPFSDRKVSKAARLKGRGPLSDSGLSRVRVGRPGDSFFAGPRVGSSVLKNKIGKKKGGFFS